MTSHNRAMLFCLTTLVLAPVLFLLGDWLGGPVLGGGLTAAAVLASFVYMRMGEEAARPHVPSRSGAGAAVVRPDGFGPPRKGGKGPRLPKAA